MLLINSTKEIKMDWIKIAKIANDLRIVPRLIMLGYAFLVWHVVDWSLIQAKITTQHAGIIASVIGIASFLVPAYFNSGNSKSKNDYER